LNALIARLTESGIGTILNDPHLRKFFPQHRLSTIRRAVVHDHDVKSVARIILVERLKTRLKIGPIVPADNHDRKIRQKLRGEPMRLTKEQRKTLVELERDRERYAAYLRSLPYTIDLGSHLVVHAGVRPGVSLEEQMASDLTEIRTMGADPSRRRGLPWYKVYQGRQTVLFGHWPSERPRRGPNAIGLDTACVYGGRLTAFIVDIQEFVSVEARDQYAKKR